MKVFTATVLAKNSVNKKKTRKNLFFWKIKRTFAKR